MDSIGGSKPRTLPQIGCYPTVNLWLLHPQSRCMYHYFMLNLSSLHKGVKLSFHSSVLWSFPLHCWWRFGCDVINHSINTSHTVADFGRHHGKKLPIKVIPASKEQNKVSWGECYWVQIRELPLTNLVSALPFLTSLGMQHSQRGGSFKC